MSNDTPAIEATDLAYAMRSRADAEQLPQDHDLRLAAEDFDRATAGFFAEKQQATIGTFMGAWSRARLAWCRHTGEPLI